jgi:hypothetical protein
MPLFFEKCWFIENHWKRTFCVNTNCLLPLAPDCLGHFDTGLIVFFLVYRIKRKIDWLIIYCSTSRSRIFHSYGDVTITGEGLQNLGLCSALRAFEQGGLIVVPHLLWHRTSVCIWDIWAWLKHVLLQLTCQPFLVKSEVTFG